jgi:hypothetical protein
MPPNPDHPLTYAEKLIFGFDGQRHPVTGMCLMRGSGAGTPDEQAIRIHLPEIEKAEGKEVANEIRRKLGVPIPEEVAAEEARLEQARAERLKAAYAALARDERSKAAYLALDEKDAAAAMQAELQSPLPSLH